MSTDTTARRRLVDDGREPSGFLNYAGDVSPDPLQPMGPNLLREVCWPVTVEPTTLPDGRAATRVGFSLITPAEVTLIERGL